MESSRIFVKNIPSTITEKEFRDHFSAKGREITDVKILANRRIGYVGYKTPAEASGAVKYFNRTFIKMSRVAVELAKPIGDASLNRAPRSQNQIPLPTDTRNSIPAPQRAEDPENPKKRKRREVDESDPNLQEYLQVMGSKRTGIAVEPIPVVQEPAVVDIKATESDDEYENIPSREAKKTRVAEPPVALPIPAAQTPDIPAPTPAPAPAPTEPPVVPPAPSLSKTATDDEWLRSRTNRILDLLDDDEEAPPPMPPMQEVGAEADVPMTDIDGSRDPGKEISQPEASQSAPAPQQPEEKGVDSDADLVRKTARLFVRNLPYSVTEDDLQEYFGKYGQVQEALLPVSASGKSKGYAMVLFADADSALAAFQGSDGIPFQGRILHIVPAAAKREGLDEFAISQLPLKKQNLIRKKATAASNTFNWNALYMNQDAVNDSIANRLGISKAELLDPTSSDAAVKQAIGETTVIQETKAYFAAHGVDLNAFKSQKRGDTAILVKNFPFGTNAEELRNLFEEHGTVIQVLMPPSGTIAIVQFAQPEHAKAAFAKLAYRRLRDSVLFLEKAPVGLLVNTPVAADSQVGAADKGKAAGIQKVSGAELLERDDEQASEGPTTSLYVRNLNFSTTTEDLANAFGHLEGLVSARVKTKTDPKKPGQVLSMGFGFVDFRTKAQAAAAVAAMDGFSLAGHTLSVKASHRGLDAAEERRQEDAAKKAANRGTKVIVKNLPFEATKKDIRTLLGTYGELRAVRVPKKFNHQSRGFAFAEFVTAREAENAIKALKDTHLLGRKLVIDYAEAETIDAEEEIEKMQKKVGGQVNKVALQKLSKGRTKISLGEEEDELDL
ncbi:related to MRD1 [Cephalotrichum gorgonifer]|uniref:Multiple RNA-binding domain-containing protein 1 n=1 Tax=Cephalotrichum gorgonifer TaxID=2041049 RepID=A0AAE8MXK1_9PEZI|nr:related to MRD1 [Cephalotrichum gorgonifer]